MRMRYDDRILYVEYEEGDTEHSAYDILKDSELRAIYPSMVMVSASPSPSYLMLVREVGRMVRLGLLSEYDVDARQWVHIGRLKRKLEKSQRRAKRDAGIR